MGVEEVALDLGVEEVTQALGVEELEREAGVKERSCFAGDCVIADREDLGDRALSDGGRLLLPARRALLTSSDSSIIREGVSARGPATTSGIIRLRWLN